MEVALRSKTQTWEFQIEPLRTPHEGLLKSMRESTGKEPSSPIGIPPGLCGGLRQPIDDERPGYRGVDLGLKVPNRAMPAIPPRQKDHELILAIAQIRNGAGINVVNIVAR